MNKYYDIPTGPVAQSGKSGTLIRCASRVRIPLGLFIGILILMGCQVASVPLDKGDCISVFRQRDVIKEKLNKHDPAKAYMYRCKR